MILTLPKLDTSKEAVGFVRTYVGVPMEFIASVIGLAEQSPDL